MAIALNIETFMDKELLKRLVVKEIPGRKVFNWGLFDSKSEEFVEVAWSKKAAEALLYNYKFPVKLMQVRDEQKERISRKKKYWEKVKSSDPKLFARMKKEDKEGFKKVEALLKGSE